MEDVVWPLPVRIRAHAKRQADRCGHSQANTQHPGTTWAPLYPPRSHGQCYRHHVHITCDVQTKARSNCAAALNGADQHAKSGHAMQSQHNQRAQISRRGGAPLF